MLQIFQILDFIFFSNFFTLIKFLDFIDLLDSSDYIFKNRIIFFIVFDLAKYFQFWICFKFLINILFEYFYIINNVRISFRPKIFWFFLFTLIFQTLCIFVPDSNILKNETSSRRKRYVYDFSEDYDAYDVIDVIKSKSP